MPVSLPLTCRNVIRHHISSDVVECFSSRNVLSTFAKDYRQLVFPVELIILADSGHRNVFDVAGYQSPRLDEERHVRGTGMSGLLDCGLVGLIIHRGVSVSMFRDILFSE